MGGDRRGGELRRAPRAGRGGRRLRGGRRRGRRAEGHLPLLHAPARVVPRDVPAVARNDRGAGHLQPEPEVALACSLGYSADGTVESIAPFAFGAFDDCSIRRPGATKISEKKNWGAGSKGVASRFLALGGTGLEQATATHRLACFLRRDGEQHRYGVDSPLPGYSYYGDRLLAWLVERLADQHGGPDDPLEPVGRYLRDVGRPASALIAIGATRYTPFGESTRLEPGDESIVVVYDSDRLDPEALPAALESGDPAPLAGASVLRRRLTRQEPPAPG